MEVLCYGNRDLDALLVVAANDTSVIFSLSLIVGLFFVHSLIAAVRQAFFPAVSQKLFVEFCWGDRNALWGGICHEPV